MGRPRKNPVPNKLRQFRREHGIPGIKTVSKATGINKDTLSLVEQGKMDLSDENKVSICRYLSGFLNREVLVTDIFYQDREAEPTAA